MANNSFADILNLNDEIKKISQSDCDLVHGFFHQNDKLNSLNTPDGIINICLLFVFKLVFQSAILTPEECEELHQMIGKQRNEGTSEWKLLYRGSRDGYKMSDCHLKCYSQPNVVLIVESAEGNVFGGFTQTGWDF